MPQYNERNINRFRILGRFTILQFMLLLGSSALIATIILCKLIN